MLKLSLDALFTVDTIARRGSFSAAAKELFRVSSTISYTITKLEEDLGVQLFEQFGPRVAITPAGKELLGEEHYLLKSTADLERRVRRVASGWETEFMIAMDSMLSPAGLLADLSAFYEVADQTRVRRVKEQLSGIWEALLDRRADLLIGAAGEGPPDGGYTTEALGTVSLVFVVSPSHPVASAEHALGKVELSHYRAVSVADSARLLQGRTVGLLFGQDAIAVPDMEYQFQLAGIGFGFLPEAWVRADIARGALIEKEVEEAKPDEIVYFAWRTAETGTALKWWKDRLRTYCSGHCSTQRSNRPATSKNSAKNAS
jgi:DNA-binding transcriptional LysR family regulator